MNKIYLFTAAFAVMASLSGCSDTELASIDTAQEKTPIGFHTVGSQMGSRATIIDNGEDLKSTTFNVYAFDGDGNPFMGENDTQLGYGGINISYLNGKWNYTTSSDLKYWPGTVKPLDFYAVNPASFDTDLMPFYGWKINKDKQEIHYTCINEYKLNNGESNIDVMYATAKNQTKDDNAGKVSLVFKHILSQIAFKAKTQDENTKVEIESIVIHNVDEAGTFTMPTEGSTGISCKISIDGKYPHGTATKFEKLYVPFEADWQPGKRYVYTLIFGGGYTEKGNPVLTPVSFVPSVESWKDVNNNINTQQ